MQRTNFQRSTCVVCGQTRYTDNMAKVFGLWVCSKRSNRIDKNMMLVKMPDGYSREYHKCKIKLLKSRHDNLKEANEVLKKQVLNTLGFDVDLDSIKL